MQAKILSLNTGIPQTIRFNGKEAMTSMHKAPIDGPLIVHRESIDGDRFQSSNHGVIDSVLYAFGFAQANPICKTLGLKDYEAGALGENVTLDSFDETQVSVGDIFSIGSVVAQATFPRIPCFKVNIRLEHPEAQETMIRLGRSGVYFRILEPGKMTLADTLKRIEKSKNPFSIHEVYHLHVSGNPWPQEKIDQAIANGAFPPKILKKWS